MVLMVWERLRWPCLEAFLCQELASWSLGRWNISDGLVWDGSPPSDLSSSSRLVQSYSHRSLGSKRASISVQGPMRSTRLGTATHQSHCILLAKQIAGWHSFKGWGFRLHFLMGEISKSCWKGHALKGAWVVVPFLQSIYLGIGGLILKSTYQVNNTSPRLEGIKVLFVCEELHHAVSFYFFICHHIQEN